MLTSNLCSLLTDEAEDSSRLQAQQQRLVAGGENTDKRKLEREAKCTELIQVTHV